jgi:hypothetical protein
MKSVVAACMWMVALSVSYACSCGSKATVPVAFRTAGAVFVGHVSGIEIVPSDDNREFDVVRCTIEVDDDASFFKGREHAKVVGNRRFVTVYTGTGGGDCGVPFVLREYFVIYAFGTQRLSTNICTRTALLSEVKRSEFSQLEEERAAARKG